MVVLKAVTCALPLIIVMICVYYISDMSILDAVKGSKGDKGSQGHKGDKGDKGDEGIKGEMGLNGTKGDQGDKGNQGPKGDKGDLGPPGHIGETGKPGAKGDPGDKGDKGDSGKLIPEFMIIHGGQNKELKCIDNKPPMMKGYSQFVKKDKLGGNMDEPDLLKGASSCVEKEYWKNVAKGCPDNESGGCNYINYWLGKSNDHPFDCIKCNTKTYTELPFETKYGKVEEEVNCDKPCYEPLWANYGYKFVNFIFQGKPSDNSFAICLEESDPEVYSIQGGTNIKLTKDVEFKCRVCVLKNKKNCMNKY